MGIRVLLVEEDSTSAQLIRAVLTASTLDFEVFAVATLAEAMDAPTVNIALLSLDGPGGSAVKAISQNRPESAIVVLTASSRHTTSADLVAAGAHAVLPKDDVSTASLLYKMREAVTTLREIEPPHRFQHRVNRTSDEVRQDIGRIRSALAALEATHLDAEQCAAVDVIRRSSKDITHRLDLLQDKRGISIP